MSSNKVDLVIYHGNCPDGWCAAYIAQKKYPEARLLPCVYGGPMPEVTGKDVLVVDFSWPRSQTLELADKANSLIIFDHHKTAEKELEDLSFATFDMNRSGATLTWDLLFGGPRPWYVNYVEDRDLWRWLLPDSKAISAYLMALPQTVEAWNSMCEPEEAIIGGNAIRLHIESYVERLIAQAQKGAFWGWNVAVVNAPYTNISDVCNALLQDLDNRVAVGWFERGDGRVQFSLRSRNVIDVSRIAKLYGGGGHQNAAGFELNKKEARQLLDAILNV